MGAPIMFRPLVFAAVLEKSRFDFLAGILLRFFIFVSFDFVENELHGLGDVFDQR